MTTETAGRLDTNFKTNNHNGLSLKYVEQVSASQDNYGEEEKLKIRVSRRKEKIEVGSGSYVSEVTPGNYAQEKKKENTGLEGEELAFVNEEEEEDENNDGNDMSDSSEAEINEIRNEIAIKSALNRTAGGNINDDNNNNNNNINMSQVYDDVLQMEKEKIEMQQNKYDKKNNINVNLFGIEQEKKNENFSSMLIDKVVGIDMIENDIVDDMEQEIQNPNGVDNGTTPGDINSNNKGNDGNDNDENYDDDDDVIYGMETAGGDHEGESYL